MMSGSDMLMPMQNNKDILWLCDQCLPPQALDALWSTSIPACSIRREPDHFYSEPPIPGGPRIKFEPTHVGCYGLIGGVVRVTHRLIMPARCRRHAKRILGRCPSDRGQ